MVGGGARPGRHQREVEAVAPPELGDHRRDEPLRCRPVDRMPPSRRPIQANGPRKSDAFPTHESGTPSAAAVSFASAKSRFVV